MWYVPVKENGSFGEFVLNGTESFAGPAMTGLRDGDIAAMLRRALEV